MPRCSAGLWQTIRNSPLYSDLYSRFYWGTDLSVFCQACLHLLAAACDPMSSRLVPTPAPAVTPLPASPAPAQGAGLAPPAQHTPAAAALGAGASPGSGAHSHSSGGGGGGDSGISSVRRKSTKRDIREITNAGTVGRLVELMSSSSPPRDLHLRTSAARLLGNLIIQRPNVCLEIAYIGISSGPGTARLSMGSVGMDESLREVAYPSVGMRSEAGWGMVGPVDGITALLCLARDTGVSAGAKGSSDVQCQRMVARCIEAISHTCHMEPAVKAKLLAMGFKESEVGQAMRMAGGTSVECAVTWLTAREETWGGLPGWEDEFEMVEDAPIDLPTMLISRGGLDIMAEMLQEPDAEVQASLWKAISALTRVGARCHTVLRSRVGQEWIVPLISEYSGGADLMVGTDRTLQQRKGWGGGEGGGGEARVSPVPGGRRGIRWAVVSWRWWRTWQQMLSRARSFCRISCCCWRRRRARRGQGILLGRARARGGCITR